MDGLTFGLSAQASDCSRLRAARGEKWRIFSQFLALGVPFYE